jgi:hypothetical protein
MIPFVDFKRQCSGLEREIEDAWRRVRQREWYILGEEGKNFEKEFANYCEREYGIGVNSGTDALKLSLYCLDIGVGDEVIIPVNTAIPTAMAIVETGAKPVLIDVRDDYLIDADQIEDRINNYTRAIMPVHLYGNVCDMDKISEIAGSYNLEVIEDCCQAHGAEYKGKKVPVGNVGCFSFYPSKNLGGFGDGGMIVTSDSALHSKLKMLRNYGQTDRYNACITGVNSRLDELQAAVLRAKLPYLDVWNEDRREIATSYNNSLKSVITPESSDKNKHVFHLYVVRSRKRDGLIAHLKRKEIETHIHYPITLHLQTAFSYLGYKKGNFPNAEKYAKQIVSLPMFPGLTGAEIEEICNVVNEYSEVI